MTEKFISYLFIGPLLCLICLGPCQGKTSCTDSILIDNKNKIFSHIDAVQTLKALSLADSILPILENKGLDKCEDYYWIKFFKAEAFEFKADYEKALVEYRDILFAIPPKKWDKLKGSTLLSLARLHESIGRPQDCLRYLEKALAPIKAIKDTSLYSRYCVRNASYHRIYNDIDSSLFYAAQALALGEKTQTESSIIDGHLLLGIIKEQLDSSIYHFNIVTGIYVKKGNFYGGISQLLNSASLILEAGYTERASKFIDEALILKDSLYQHYPREYDVLAQIYALKSRYFKQKQMPDSALFYLEKSLSIQSKYDEQLNQEVINKDEIDFAIRSEKKKREFSDKRTRVLQIMLGAFIILLLFLGVMLLRNFKKSKKIKEQNVLISEKNNQLKQSYQKQSTLLSEVHHRVKNNLQLIISIITIQTANIKDPLLNEEMENISEKIRSIALIHEQLYRTTEFEKIELRPYITNLLNHYRSFKISEDMFSFEIECEDIFLNLETSIPLGMILTELITNSLKYGSNVSNNLHLDISLIEKNNSFHLSYQDNGTGYKTIDLEKQSSMGAILIRSMVRQLKGEHYFYNNNGAGFKLIFNEKVTSPI